MCVDLRIARSIHLYVISSWSSRGYLVLALIIRERIDSDNIPEVDSANKMYTMWEWLRPIDSVIVAVNLQVGYFGVQRSLQVFEIINLFYALLLERQEENLRTLIQTLVFCVTFLSCWMVSKIGFNLVRSHRQIIHQFLVYIARLPLLKSYQVNNCWILKPDLHIRINPPIITSHMGWFFICMLQSWLSYRNQEPLLFWANQSFPHVFKIRCA